NAGAASTDYMHLFGLVSLGYMWGRMVKVAGEGLASGANGQSSFYESKIVTGRYFMERVMPETAAHLARISTGADTMMALPAEAVCSSWAGTFTRPSGLLRSCRWPAGRRGVFRHDRPRRHSRPPETRMGHRRCRHALRHGASLPRRGDRAA